MIAMPTPICTLAFAGCREKGHSIGGTGLLSKEALGAWFGPVQWGTTLGFAVGVVLLARLWVHARDRRQKCLLLLAAKTAAAGSKR